MEISVGLIVIVFGIAVLIGGIIIDNWQDDKKVKKYHESRGHIQHKELEDGITYISWKDGNGNDVTNQMYEL